MRNIGIWFGLVWWTLTASAQNQLNHVPNAVKIYELNLKDSVKERPIRMDWVNLDIELFKRLNNLDSSSASFKKLVQTLKGPAKGSYYSRKINHGLQLSKIPLYGGYTSVYLDVLHKGDTLLQVNAHFGTYRELLEAYYLPVITIPLFGRYHHVEYQRFYTESIHEIQRLDPTLFYPYFGDTTQRSAAIRFFSDIEFSRPHLDLEAHQPHVYSSYWTEGVPLLKSLVERKDTAALINIIHSPWPENTMMAAGSLNYLRIHQSIQLTPAVSQKVDDILQADSVIRNGIISCWVGRFDYEYIDVKNNFEELILNEQVFELIGWKMRED
ncbi:MAG: hypothetical protein H6608_10530 [Flavobacteriales bacterium]|nr:hypothetical protein [Flavobacteriales bacterium]